MNNPSINRTLLDFFEIHTISQGNCPIPRRVHGTRYWWRRITFHGWFWWFFTAGDFVSYYVPRLCAWIMEFDGQNCSLLLSIMIKRIIAMFNTFNNESDFNLNKLLVFSVHLKTFWLNSHFS